MKSCSVLLPLILAAAGTVTIAAAQSAGTFTATGNMTTARSSHIATLLANGKVLIAGGGSATLELYDPSTGTFSVTGGATASTNVGSATLLPDGRVLLIEAQRFGPYPSGGILSVGTQGAEIYDPSTGVIAATGSLIEAQTGYTATLLPNGRVLITGGTNGVSDCCSQAASPELYDPSTQTFSLAGPYADAGASPYVGTSGLTYTTATPLTDGTVLVSSESTAELYDPVANAFELTGSMTAPYFFLGPAKPTAISGRAAALLLDRKVLLAGGAGGYDDTGDIHPLSSSEVYEPSTGTFTATQDMATFRFYHTATTLPDGTVLITGGLKDFFLTTTPIAELYSPAARAFFMTGNMQSGRFSHRATLLADGRVLITGGSFSNGYTTATFALSSAEIYTPAVLVPAPVLFSLSGDGKGQGAIWHAATGQVVSPDNAAAVGEYLSMYATGLGDGSVIPPQVAVGGQLAEVTYFGAAPGYPGYYQVNFRVPSGVAPGPAVSVRLMYVGRPSNQVTIGVQ